MIWCISESHLGSSCPLGLRWWLQDLTWERRVWTQSQQWIQKLVSVKPNNNHSNNNNVQYTLLFLLKPGLMWVWGFHSVINSDGLTGILWDFWIDVRFNGNDLNMNKNVIVDVWFWPNSAILICVVCVIVSSLLIVIPLCLQHTMTVCNDKMFSYRRETALQGAL